MFSAKKYEIGIDKLLEKFQHGEANEDLSIGSLDNDVRRFIVSVLKSMVENYSDDDAYFSLVSVLGDLAYRLSDYETGYRVWIKFNIDRINEIGSGTKEDLEKIKELISYFSL
jgi:hypothetical protein